MEFTPIEDLKTEVENMASAFFKSLPNLTIALVILIVTLIAGRIIRAIVSTAMHRARVRDALVTLAQNLISIAAWIVGVAIAMTVIFPSVSPSDIIAGLGLTSVAIGFAFKDILQNMLAGILILYWIYDKIVGIDNMKPG